VLQQRSRWAKGHMQVGVLGATARALQTYTLAKCESVCDTGSSEGPQPMVT
jgi:hypothetical protein